MPRPFVDLHQLALRTVKIIVRVARCDVQMVMPNILVSGWLVMLTGGYTVAAIGNFHSQCQITGCTLNGSGITQGQIIEIFIMFVGNEDYIARVIGPLVRTDKCRDFRIMIDDITLYR